MDSTIIKRFNQNKYLILASVMTLLFCVWTLNNVDEYQQRCNNYWDEYIDQCDCQCNAQATPYTTPFSLNLTQERLTRTIGKIGE